MTAKNERRPAGHGHGVQNELAVSSKDTAELGALDLERDAVGRQLTTLARRVARLDLAGLATVATGPSYAFGGDL